MIFAVYDCNVVASAIGWGGTPRYCLDLAFAGQVRICVTTDIWQEYDATIAEVMRREQRTADVPKALAILLKIAHFAEPAPLGKPRSRDPKDDIYLACAVGAGAQAIVTNDRDLLVLQKPFGVQICTPIEFLKLVRSQSSL